MTQIREFIVLEPPTSGDLRTRALEALKDHGNLSMTVQGTQEVPKSQPEEVNFNIQRVSRYTDKGLQFIGRSVNNDIVSVVAQGDESQPAIGDIIS